MTIREAVAGIALDEAQRLAGEYFAPSEKFPGTRAYTGAHFDTFAQDHNLTNTLTAPDLLAVQCLSVTVPPRAALGILGDSSQEISRLLSNICPELSIERIENEKEFEKHLGDDSPAQELWNLLRRNDRRDRRWGIGPTTASKILARKRPHLIPIEDSVVNQVTGIGGKNSWRQWWEALREDEFLAERASSVRSHVGQPRLSTLRTLDIVLWKWGVENGRN